MKTLGKYINSLLFLSLFFIVISCSSEDSSKQKSKSEETETWSSGTFTFYCDQSLMQLLEKPIEWYRKDYPNVKLNVISGSSRFAMAKLLSGEARVIATSREYLHDEDSLMKAYKVTPHVKMPMAYDGLVFFTRYGFPLDTINSSQLKELLTNSATSFGKYFPSVKIEPVLAVCNNNSAEYANLIRLVTAGPLADKKFRFFGNTDSVRLFVKNNVNSIGIAYLSQVYEDTTFKTLRIGFNDANGKYIRPKPVHQSYIVQDLYPYKVTHWVYILEDRRNLPFWFAKYLSIEEKVQRYFLKSGIVPAYAKIKIIPEDY